MTKKKALGPSAVDEEKLNNLSALLDRLDLQYGTQSLPSTPLKRIAKPPNDNKTSFNRPPNYESPPNSIHKECSLPVQDKNAVVPGEKVDGQGPVQVASTVEQGEQPAELAKENKQALRKARKEAKQISKTAKKEKTTNGVDKPAEDLNKANAAMSENKNKVSDQKSKADLKRERREKQESQRKAKAEAEQQKVIQRSEIKQPVTTAAKDQVVLPKKIAPKIAEPVKRIPLLGHLPMSKSIGQLSINQELVHPAMRTVGLRMKEGLVDGCNARVLATLSAIVSLIEDYKTPPSVDLARDICSRVDSNIDFLGRCRPIPEPMNNAIRFVKKEINAIPHSTPEVEAKDMLIEAIDTYVHQHITLASKAIQEHAVQLLEDCDTILTFGYSALVLDTVKMHVQKGRRISVVVADALKHPSGTLMLKRLGDLGIKVYYRAFADVCHIIKKITKVVVEAEAVVLNGAIMGECGLAGLILIASNHSVPVIVLCHTYKFCNIDLTDSLVVNELRVLKGQGHSSSTYHHVKLVYDVTPSQLVNVLVTEQNNYPTSVVPVIIKRNYADILGQD